MTYPPVTVQYFKYPRELHWRHDVVRLGEDGYGVWLGGVAGSTIQRGYEPPTESRDPFVQLIPSDAWWVLIYNGDRPKTRYYVDIVTPPEWVDGSRVEMIDLDLDVVRYQDGSVAVLDEDEFEQHRVDRNYPAEIVERVRATTEEIASALQDGAEPFGTAPERWMKHLLSENHQVGA